MQPLFPPEYPYRPDAPLLSFGPSFSEEIARSVMATLWHDEEEEPEETEGRFAASLTMLEAFHPRDHLECMLAAQAVAAHNMIMDLHHRITKPDVTEPIAIKLRGNIAQIARTFSLTLHDLERRQAKPLPERPPPEAMPAPPVAPPPVAPPPAAPPSGPVAPSPGTEAPDASNAMPDDTTDRPADIETRPDGTPGTLAAYVPKREPETFVPEEPLIMWALATRPKPWRMVNASPDEPHDDPLPPVTPDEGISPDARGPLDLRERMFTGDALARFTSARLDPNKPVEMVNLDDEDSVVELELINTGGDPEAEEERRLMIAAHPEGKPIVTFRYGTRKPPEKPPEDG
jgi:hypothetical protein